MKVNLNLWGFDLLTQYISVLNPPVNFFEVFQSQSHFSNLIWAAFQLNNANFY